MQKPSRHNTSFGKEWEVLPTVDSTNNCARSKVASEPTEEGTVIQAMHQTHGRGQQSKLWNSAAGQNALFTLVLKPEFLGLRKMSFLNFAVAVACRDAIARILPDSEVLIKWPNDIYIEHSKICGILIENALAEKARFSLVGIGVNVNQIHFPEELHHAISLKMISGLDFQIEQVIQTILEELEKNYNELRLHPGLQRIREIYISHMYQLHKILPFRHESDTYLAQLVGVDPLGRIVFASEGHTMAYAHGDIEVLWKR